MRRKAWFDQGFSAKAKTGIALIMRQMSILAILTCVMQFGTIYAVDEKERFL